MQSLVLLAAFINAIEFLLKRKITKFLIVLFYLTVLMVTTGTIAMSAYTLKNYSYGVEDPMFLTLDVVKSTALAIMYWTVGLSMYQLGISIQVIFEQINKKQAKFRLTIMYITVSVFMACLGYSGFRGSLSTFFPALFSAFLFPVFSGSNADFYQVHRLPDQPLVEHLPENDFAEYYPNRFQVSFEVSPFQKDVHVLP